LNQHSLVLLRQFLNLSAKSLATLAWFFYRGFIKHLSCAMEGVLGAGGLGMVSLRIQ